MGNWVTRSFISWRSGGHFVKMVAGEYVNTQKLMLIK